MKKLDSILLIDDDEVTNFVNESLIEQMDLAEEILIANNGLEALDIIHNQCLIQGYCPDLILLDINMPVMNGFEFLQAYEQITRDNKQSTIIMILTTSMNPKDIKQSEAFDIAAYINKPLKEDTLQQVLQEYFD